MSPRCRADHVRADRDRLGRHHGAIPQPRLRLARQMGSHGYRECDGGCGLVPFRYRDKNFVNALQWAIGLELFLLIEDPWRVFLTTDHPNGAPFTAYPHLVRLLMDRSYRNECLKQLHPAAQAATVLGAIEREYTLARDRHHDPRRARPDPRPRGAAAARARRHGGHRRLCRRRRSRAHVRSAAITSSRTASRSRATARSGAAPTGATHVCGPNSIAAHRAAIRAFFQRSYEHRPRPFPHFRRRAGRCRAAGWWRSPADRGAGHDARRESPSTTPSPRPSACAATRLIITADTPAGRGSAAESMTGFATSVIGCGVEAGIERELAPERHPDGRPGRRACCSSPVSRDALPRRSPPASGSASSPAPAPPASAGLAGREAPAARPLRCAISATGGRSAKRVGGRRYWRIPVMDGEFVCEDEARVAKAASAAAICSCSAASRRGGACRRRARDRRDARGVPEVIMPFPGRHRPLRIEDRLALQIPDRPRPMTRFCPTLRGGVVTELDPDIASVLEIVIDGLTEAAVGTGHGSRHSRRLPRRAPEAAHARITRRQLRRQARRLQISTSTSSCDDEAHAQGRAAAAPCRRCARSPSGLPGARRARSSGCRSRSGTGGRRRRLVSRRRRATRPSRDSTGPCRPPRPHRRRHEQRQHPGPRATPAPISALACAAAAIDRRRAPPASAPPPISAAARSASPAMSATGSAAPCPVSPGVCATASSSSRGNAGERRALRCSAGWSIIAGSAGAGCGAEMLAGTIVVGGAVGAYAGTAMRRGSIIALGGARASARASSIAACMSSSSCACWRVSSTGSASPPLARRLGPLRRFAGDAAVAGRGELLVAP